MKDSRLGVVLGLLAVLLLGFACSTDTADDPLGSGQGRLAVEVHDQPSASIAEAWVTFAAVQAVPEGGGFEDVGGVELGTPINIAELTDGRSVTIAAGALPAGSYTGLRLSVSAVTLVLDDDSDVDPLAPAQGVVVAVPVAFTVVEGQDTALSVDFPLSAFTFDGALWTFDGARVVAD